MLVRNRLHDISWLLLSLIVLACPGLAPHQKSEGLAVASGPDCQSITIATNPFGPTIHHHAAMDDDYLPDESALAGEDDESDRADARNESQATFLITCSFRKILACPVSSRRSIPSLYPLRC